MVHQHFRLVETATVAENITMGQEPIKKIAGCIPILDRKKAEADIQALSKLYGLEVDPSLRIEEISVSIRQRVEILKMLYREAEILIFDEPTAMLTPQEIEYLLSILVNLKQQGKSIILITHKLDEIKKVADRCAILQKGKLMGVFDVATTTAQQMADLMVGHELSMTLEKAPAHYGDEILNVSHLRVVNRDKFAVVNDVSFSVRRGEIFAIAGVAGNGQIELADALTGLLPIESGTVLFESQDITKESIRDRTDAGIAYVPEDRQNVGLILDFSLGHNLSLKTYYSEPNAKHGTLQEDVIHSRAQQSIQRYDIRCSQAANTIVRSMSGGNQQKVIVGREIELDADLLIFVQPTRGLDIGATTEIHREILKQRELGKAILLISLELEEVMSLADTIGVMYSGHMNRIAPIEQWTTHQVGAYMMGVEQSEN
jgi:simple sugar transport system ATP-binding protein